MSGSPFTADSLDWMLSVPDAADAPFLCPTCQGVLGDREGWLAADGDGHCHCRTWVLGDTGLDRVFEQWIEGPHVTLHETAGQVDIHDYAQRCHLDCICPAWRHLPRTSLYAVARRLWPSTSNDALHTAFGTDDVPVTVLYDMANGIVALSDTFQKADANDTTRYLCLAAAL